MNKKLYTTSSNQQQGALGYTKYILEREREKGKGKERESSNNVLLKGTLHVFLKEKSERT